MGPDWCVCPRLVVPVVALKGDNMKWLRKFISEWLTAFSATQTSVAQLGKCKRCGGPS